MNYLALLVAALIPMLVGFIWYNPKVLGTLWQKEAGLTDEAMKKANMPLIFGLSLLFALFLSVFISGIATHDTYVKGATYYIEQNGTEAEKAEAKAWQESYARMVTNNPKYTDARWTHGLMHGMLVLGIFCILPIFVTSGLFERKSWKYIFVNAGYWIITVGLMSMLLAVWK